MLLAEVETPSDQHLYVLADPDPLENHGIADPANARFAVALVRLLWNGHKAIVFDESVHGGYIEKRSPLELLFQFPYNIVLGQSLVARRAAAARDHRAIWRLGAGAAALHARQDPAHRQHRRADGPGRSPGRRAAPLHPVRAAGRRTCAARAARPRRYRVGALARPGRHRPRGRAEIGRDPGAQPHRGRVALAAPRAPVQGRAGHASLEEGRSG